MVSDSDVIQEVAPNRDRYDIWFGAAFMLFLGSMVVLSFSFDSFTGSHVLALVTAVSAFAAIYQLRHSRDPTPPPVRPDFEQSEESGLLDFGLRNFGSDPALYIQLVAVIDGARTVELRPRERPVHLSEDDFLGIVHDKRLQERLIDTYDLSDADDENGDDATVELYYSYVSKDGVREPQDLDIGDVRDDECLFDEITAEDQVPREMEIARLRGQRPRF